MWLSLKLKSARNSSVGTSFVAMWITRFNAVALAFCTSNSHKPSANIPSTTTLCTAMITKTVNAFKKLPGNYKYS
jgi:hypothetical protein